MNRSARGQCMRCRARFASPVKFSEHLALCDEPWDVEAILDRVGTERLSQDVCWPYRNTGSVPKVGYAPKKVMYACNLLATAVYGVCPEGLILLHSCDNRLGCMNPQHLSWGTHQQNNRDAWRNKRRTMSAEQQAAMADGRARSQKNQTRMVEHNRALADKNRGDNHWTRRSPEAMHHWKERIAAGRRKEGDAQ